MDKQYKQQGYNKKYLSRFEGFYLYIIKDLKGNILYVGATTNYKKRLSNHSCGNVKATKDFISQGNYIIEYVNLNEIIEEEIELYALENKLIELYATELNHKNKDGSYRLTDVRTIDELRMFSLISYIHSFNVNWTTYCTNKRIKGVSMPKKRKNKLSNATNI